MEMKYLTIHEQNMVDFAYESLVEAKEHMMKHHADAEDRSPLNKQWSLDMYNTWKTEVEKLESQIKVFKDLNEQRTPKGLTL